MEVGVVMGGGGGGGVGMGGVAVRPTGLNEAALASFPTLNPTTGLAVCAHD